MKDVSDVYYTTFTPAHYSFRLFILIWSLFGVLVVFQVRTGFNRLQFFLFVCNFQLNALRLRVAITKMAIVDNTPYLKYIRHFLLKGNRIWFNIASLTSSF